MAILEAVLSEKKLLANEFLKLRTRTSIRRSTFAF